jgi:hypothetical protein
MSKRKPSSTPSPDALTVVPGREVTYHNVPAPKPGRVATKLTTKREVRAAPRHKHQRRIQISVVLPASVEILVGTNDDDPSEDSDWEILSVRSASCEASPRMVQENMHDVDFEALAAAAASAEDEA